jgi:hypothetical protein
MMEEYDYRGLSIEIDGNFAESKEEVILLANSFADYYINQKDFILEYVYQVFEERKLYIEEHTKEEIFELLGSPTISVVDDTLFKIDFLDNELDANHMISVEVEVLDKKEYHLSYVTVDE